MPIITEEPLRKYDPSSFSFGTVKDEVAGGMRDDWKYGKVDDAKKRAIYDCKDYNDFKMRVAGCTLKPIHRAEFNAPPKFAFNRQVGSQSAPDDQTGITPVSLRGSVPLSGSRCKASAMRTGREFEREMRRCTSQESKVALLQELDGEACGRLFGRELDAEVLRHLLIALDETTASGDVPAALGRSFLTLLATHCPSSASVAASFFTNEEREMIARLLARGGGQHTAGQDDIVRICAALGVTPKLIMAAEIAVQETPVPAAVEVTTTAAAATAAAAAAADGTEPTVSRGTDTGTSSGTVPVPAHLSEVGLVVVDSYDSLD